MTIYTYKPQKNAKKTTFLEQILSFFERHEKMFSIISIILLFITLFAISAAFENPVTNR